jgi:hypothetical protein
MTVEDRMRAFSEKVADLIEVELEEGTPVESVLVGITVGLLLKSGATDEQIHALVDGAIASVRALYASTGN